MISSPGPEVQANYVVMNALAQAALGRPLTGGATATAWLLQPGQIYGDRLNQVDLRVAKPMHVGRATTTVNVDLFNAFNLIESLVSVAWNYNRSVTLTIHQRPTPGVSPFDQLVVLAMGKLVYLGESAQYQGNFESIGHPRPPGFIA